MGSAIGYEGRVVPFGDRIVRSLVVFLVLVSLFFFLFGESSLLFAVPLFSGELLNWLSTDCGNRLAGGRCAFPAPDRLHGKGSPKRPSAQGLKWGS